MRKAGAVWVAGTAGGAVSEGVRAALVCTDGQRIRAFGATGHQAYDGAAQRCIRAAAEGTRGLAAAAEAVETAHAVLLSRFEGAGLVGFAGQECPGMADRIGSGMVLAEVLGLPVVWDFSAADLELGGAGEPLMPFFLFACTQWLGIDRPMAWLDLGKVGRLTWLDPRADDPAGAGACLAFETGPGPIGPGAATPRDEEGQGQVDLALIGALAHHPHFFRSPPKRVSDHDFAAFRARLGALTAEDARATLKTAVARCVILGQAHFPAPVTHVLVLGAGRRDAALLGMISAGMGCPVQPVESVGLDGEAMAAQGFAHLAMRVLRGLPTSCPGTTGARAAIGGGMISRPGAG